MEPNYYNTTKLSGDELKTRRQRAISQTKSVLEFFKRIPGDFTAWELYQIMMLPDVPITSIRRALTDLEAAGELQMTGKRVSGPYDEKCNIYKLPGK